MDKETAAIALGTIMVTLSISVVAIQDVEIGDFDLHFTANNVYLQRGFNLNANKSSKQIRDR